MRKGQPMVLSQFVKEFRAIGYIAVDGNSVVLKDGLIHNIDNLDDEENESEEDIFLLSLNCENVEEKLKKLELSVLDLDLTNIGDSSKLKNTKTILMLIGHTELGNLRAMQMSDKNISIVSNIVLEYFSQSSGKENKIIRIKDMDDSIPMIVSFGQLNVVDDDNSTSENDSIKGLNNKIFYDSYNLEGLSGSPVIAVNSNDDTESISLLGVHIGESQSPNLRMAQKIDFAKFKNVIDYGKR